MIEDDDRLKLESALNQIYNNDNIYDGSVTSFTFYNVNYIFFNGVYIYPKHNDIVVNLDKKMLGITTQSMFVEIKYSDIHDFIIKTEEAKNV